MAITTLDVQLEDIHVTNPAATDEPALIPHASFPGRFEPKPSVEIISPQLEELFAQLEGLKWPTYDEERKVGKAKLTFTDNNEGALAPLCRQLRLVHNVAVNGQQYVVGRENPSSASTGHYPLVIQILSANAKPYRLEITDSTVDFLECHNPSPHDALMELVGISRKVESNRYSV